MRVTNFVKVLCVSVVLAGFSLPARAHDTALSGIRVLYRSHDVVVNVSTHISRLLRAEGSGHTTMTPIEMDMAIRRRLHIRFDGKDLAPEMANVIGDNANDILSWQTVVTTPVRECEVLSRLYPEDAASQTVVTLLRDGEVFQETVLDATHPDLLRNEPRPKPFAVALRYVREGIGHIFGGPDHVLFVLGLILLGGTLKPLLRTVTAFTLAHSITLSLAATGIWNPSPRFVEPLIALSIVAIAVENMRHLRNQQSPDRSVSDRQDWRPCYAFGFGLIHGFGFAGALAEVGIPKSALWVSLASFNVGVEMGQATIVLLAMPGLNWLLNTRPLLLKRVVLAGSLVIGVAGAYWFFARLAPL